MISQSNTTPDVMSTLSTWLDYLKNLHKNSINLGLDRINAVVQKLTVLNPAPYVITVAGTNGKGTTCRMLEAILLESGYRVGVYSSPHLLRYNERVRINNKNPTDMQFTGMFYLIEQKREGIPLTYFEFTTLAALLLFKQANLDVVILEVGLGGRLDATNIIDSDMAVITSIDLDHTEFLGDNRESIGREKAGIFRPCKDAIIGEPMMPQSVFDSAKQLGTRLNSVSPNTNANWSYRVFDHDWCFFSDIQNYSNLPFPKIPLANAATALAALTYSSLMVNEKAVKMALSTAVLPGRMQQINNDPMVIVDVAHNPHAASYLNQQIQYIRNQHNKGVLRCVIGMLHDKDIAATLAALSADYWYCGSLSGDRGAAAAELAVFLPQNCTQLFPSISAALQSALMDAAKNDMIIVCGSFHTIAEVMEDMDYE